MYCNADIGELKFIQFLTNTHFISYSMGFCMFFTVMICVLYVDK